jgi:hypothetical protein
MTPAKLVETLQHWQRLHTRIQRAAQSPDEALYDGGEALRELGQEIDHALVDALRERTRWEQEGKGAPWK